MKRLLISIVLPLLLVTGIYCQESFLQINGYVETVEGQSVDGAAAVLYIGGSKVNSISTGADGGFSFKLEFGKEYKLIVSKPGMIQKRIDFNTNIGPDLQKKYVNDFAISLTKSCQGAKTDVFREPVDIISFQEGDGNFASNRDYFEKMQSRIAEAYASIEKCFQDKFDEKKDAADAAFKTQNYEEARKLYQEALKIMPNNTSAKKQLSQIDKSIKSKAQNEEKYAQLIKEADQMANQGQLNGAIAKYEQATRIKPGDTYSQNKAQELNKQLAVLAQEAQAKKDLDQKYNGLIAQANTALAQKKYEEAKIFLEEAKTLKPAEAYPAQKLAEAQKGLERQEQEKLVQEAKDQAYADAMAKGQEAMQKGDFVGAQAFFQQALAQKPSASEPRNIIAQAQKLEEQRKEEEIRAKREDVERQFNEMVQKADGLLVQKQFDKAIEAYQQAIGLKASDKYANSQLIKAKNMKVEAEQQRLADIEKSYEKALVSGDALKLAQKFEEAITAYQAALAVKPSDTKANAKIAEAQKLLAAQQAKIKEDTENKARFNQLVQEGDGLFKGQQYKESKVKYAEALSIYTSEVYPKNQVTKIDNIIAKQVKEEEYNSIVGKADNAFNEQRLDEARTLYSQAQLVIPEKTYPAQKINEITELQSKLAKEEVLAKYDKLAADAESAITEKDYDAAKQLYTQAGQLMPENPFPAQRINEINTLIDKNAKQQIEQKYNEVIAQADGLFNQQQLDQAKQLYQRTVTEFPDKQYPKDKINEINKLLGDLARQGKQAEFEKLVADAETAVDNEAYDNAKQYLVQASKVIPENPYPQRRINEINALIDSKSKNTEEEAYNKLISQADGLFGTKKYEEAKAVYGQARLKMPENPYPNEKINEINQVLSRLARKEVTERYNSYIAEADQLFGNESYEEARGKFQQAAKVIPENTYPQQKINEINTILSAAVNAKIKEQEIQKRYDAAINLADQHFSDKNYILAKGEYNKALSIFPGESYPVQQIAKADELIAEQQRLLAEQESLDKQVREAINTADGFFRDKKLVQSKEFYQKTLTLKPGHVHAKSQIQRIDEMLAEQNQAIVAKEQQEKQYNDFIANADAKFKANDFQIAKKSYMAAQALKPNELYPKEQIKKIDDMLQALAGKKTVNASNQSNTTASENAKIGDLKFKSESDRKVYLAELKKKYSQGVTCEIYKEGNKTIKRYIVYRKDEIHEFREIYFSWGGKSYTYDGKPTNAYHVQKNVKPLDGEAYTEKKM